ncbi:phosphoglycerate dehydrogenase-like enzyme [Kribbella aluminosa]|uniref:Phosphoglycerate dehydrogenase-like enzyme n=1 Tax=Kribbella aluminosa TaxID=416017 RepID=A0ABS4UX11_9ACTN|nr:hydroxyacid dehydrogenase [Kribbella aluminosa]MBP2356153.1 phosphoglycerate dehydrogenase-like enzyme [Kribbella aluminosa]
MGRTVRDELFGPDDVRRLNSLVNLRPGHAVQDFATVPDLGMVEVLVTGWGCPPVDAGVLRRAPRLRAIVHTGGSVKHHVTDACWEQGIVVSSAVEANAVPVAEYTLAAILFGQKRVIETSRRYCELRESRSWASSYAGFGNYRRVVGIVGASRIGRRVIELLAPFDLEVQLADPYVDREDADRLGVRLVELDELLAASDTVSLHVPSLPETRHLLNDRRLALMRDGATLINTARGAVVDGAALTRELISRRLHAVIDVTEPEPLPADSPLYDLPNVLLTPHIAGSLGNELRRLVDHSLDELERWTQGNPFASPVRRELLSTSA